MGGGLWRVILKDGRRATRWLLCLLLGQKKLLLLVHLKETLRLCKLRRLNLVLLLKSGALSSKCLEPRCNEALVTLLLG